MSKTKASVKPMTAPVTRRFGEATLAPLTIADHAFNAETNTKQFSYSVDLESVPPPAFKFLCDAIKVSVADGDCRFMFMQRDLVEPGKARALLVLHMSPHMTSLFARSISIDSKFDYVSFEQFELRQEPGEVRAVEATYVHARGTDDSGAIDFFYVSPFDLVKMQIHSTSLPVEPVVRVQIRPRLYHSFLRYVKSTLDLEADHGRV
jgi:hypothetical protein